MYAEYEKRLEADLFSALKANPSRDLSTISLRPGNIPTTNPMFDEEEEEEDEEEEGEAAEGEESEDSWKYFPKTNYKTYIPIILLLLCCLCMQDFKISS